MSKIDVDAIESLRRKKVPVEHFVPALIERIRELEAEVSALRSGTYEWTPDSADMLRQIEENGK